MKDKNWLKDESRKFLEGRGFLKCSSITKGILRKIDQLPDEREQLEIAYEDMLKRKEFEFDEKVYVVIKKPVVPQFVDEHILDMRKSNRELRHILNTVQHKYTWDYMCEIDEWIMNNEKKFVEAWYNGYMVEEDIEEPKYVLAIDITDKESKADYTTYLNKRGIFHSMDNDSFSVKDYHWTEKDIRDLDNGDILFEHFAKKIDSD